MNNEKNETKLIIEGKEFELIKYSCDLNDKWYCGELGIMIEKKVGTGTSLVMKKGEIDWNGYSSGREKDQLQRLIDFGKDEVKYWKMKVRKLKETWPDIRGDAGREISDQFDHYEVRLCRSEEGLKDLLELKEKKLTNHE